MRLLHFRRIRAAERIFTLLLLLAAALVLFACAHAPRVQGVPAVSCSPSVPWAPPFQAQEKSVSAGPALSIDQIGEKISRLTLADVVGISLENNPETRVAWANARAAAANYGSAKGEYFPTINLDGGLVRWDTPSLIQSTGKWDTSSDPLTDYSVSASLSWLLLDFGGRSAAIEESRQALLAADWTHNAAIQDMILQAEMAFFSYAGSRALLEANRNSLAEAEANLNAAEERHRVGLATRADVLQARTARSEVQLAVQSTEGQVRVARAALAVSMGYPAHLSPRIDVVSPETLGAGLSESVDQLIEQALSRRPDLQASRALALKSEAEMRNARSALFPSLSVQGSFDRLWRDDVPEYRDSYSGALLLQIPVFSGFSRRHNLRRAQAEAEAAREEARGMEQTVMFEVFSAHSDFLTAQERVKTAADFLASASQSAEVALGQYKEGVGSILDLLSAQKSLAMARAEQINAHLGWFVSLAQLAHDVGILGLRGDIPSAPGAFSPR